MSTEHNVRQVKHQEHAGDHFSLYRQWSAAVCLISITTKRFYSATIPSWFTMTMYQHTLVCQCCNFWPLWTVAPHLSFLTWFGHLWFLLICENETADITTQNSNKPVPGMLDLLHKLRQGPLWRWKQWTIISAKEFFVTDSAWELMNTPLCTEWFILIPWLTSKEHQNISEHHKI